MASGDLSSKPGENEELKERYAEYKCVLVALLGQEETSTTAFTLCMRLLKVEGDNLRQKQDHSTLPPPQVWRLYCNASISSIISSRFFASRSP